MPTRQRRRPLPEAERAARRDADRQRVEHAARQLLSSDGWQRWIRVRATNGLSRYSLRNQWLIAADCHARAITPTYVAGFRAFLALNRCVRKGESAIRILAPVVVAQRDDQPEESTEKRLFFRTVSVFDVSMTDPLHGRQPIALTALAQPISGDSHRHLIAPLQRLGSDLGYRVEFRDLPDGPGGWCDEQHHEIVVASGPRNREVRTLVHELAHALGVRYEHYGRAQAEVLVDCVTHIVCSSVGLDVSGESIPYIAGWGEDGALQAISTYADTIDTIARRIENAIATHGPTADAPILLATPATC